MHVCSKKGWGLVVLLLVLVQAGWAQEAGRITGTVRAVRGGQPLAGLNVVVVGTLYGAVTDAAGRFAVDPVLPGSYTLQVEALGFRAESREVTVTAGEEAVVAFLLRAPDVELEEVETVGARRDLMPKVSVEERRIFEAGVQDPGEALRLLPGVQAARPGLAGPVPVVRGLAGDQVAVFVDGARNLTGSSYGIGSPLGRVDAGLIASTEVVQGPYALTWGPGALTALWIETRGASLPSGSAQGVFDVGYAGDRQMFEVVGHVSGASDAVTYAVLAAHRSGDDYHSGGDARVPAGGRDTDVRGRLDLPLGPGRRLVLRGGFHDQRDLDAPGRLLDVRSATAEHVSARLQAANADGPFRAVDAMVYWNGLSQSLDDRDRPGVTDSTRRALGTGHRQLGGRFTTQLAPVRGVALEAGFDAYRAWYDAVRSLDRDVKALPDAHLTDVGVFANATWTAGRVEASGTVRLDHVYARAGLIIDSLRQAVLAGMQRDADDTFLSGALTLATRVRPGWRLGIGAGTTARPANAVQRYANGLPYERTHPVDAVQGIPQLRPERSMQVDVWLDADHDRLDLRLAVFARRLDDFITLSPTRLDVLIPPASSVDPVRYVNGAATFWGGEAALTYALMGEFVTVHADASYLWGRDDDLAEPAFGVAPLAGSAGGRLQAPANLFFLEGEIRWAATQSRVAASRGEPTTGGYVTADVRFGLALPGAAALVLGMDNLADASYAHHLNPQDPFTLLRLPEPGRIFYARLRLFL